jgi:pimeloyl-ACP methyl ester carboxylesterase
MAAYVQLGDVRTSLPRSQLAIVPGTGHGLPADKPDLFTRLVTDFLTQDSPPPDDRG